MHADACSCQAVRCLHLMPASCCGERVGLAAVRCIEWGRVPQPLLPARRACRQDEAGSEEALLRNASSDVADPVRQQELAGLRSAAKEE